MSILIFTATIIFSISSVAAVKSKFAIIKFENNLIKEEYKITYGTSHSFIHFKPRNTKEIKKEINGFAARSLINEANRIIWKSITRKPSSISSCHKYLSISTSDEKHENICRENALASGHAFGFINKLKQIKNGAN